MFTWLLNNMELIFKGKKVNENLKRNIIAFIISIIFLISINFIMVNQSKIIRTLFTYPSSLVASVLLGAQLIDESIAADISDIKEPDFILYKSNYLLRITEECSGFNYFILLCALAVFVILSKKHGFRKYLISFLVYPFLYVSVIVINGLRIVLSFFVMLVFYGSPYSQIFHLMIGFLFFIPFFFFCYYALKRWF